ncbi:MAG TPA: tRNA (adenosine(37)-N6)-dimethylallyltransferase MiaA [Humibacter sp.]|nr:tRNA (adenosine(37)-N6)-dimethylallyltransferase MiaA [Humibacter sp.]
MATRSRSCPERRFLAIVGATGTGKSAFALDLACELERRGFAAEIVNADAMQLYRGMDIGTAKLPPDERRGVRHHLLDVLEVTDEASVARYQSEARETIDRIAEQGGIPILVGGSGLYVSSVVHDFRFPGRDQAARARLEEELAATGVAALYARLMREDPDTARRVDPANARRVVRALEIHEMAESGHGAMLPERPTAWRPVLIADLVVPRAQLTARLDARVERMWADGLLDEVAGLLGRGIADGVTARRAIGYAQALAQLSGESDSATAIAETQRLTRRYARRQVSWFSRYPSVERVDASAAVPITEVGRLVDRLIE